MKTYREMLNESRVKVASDTAERYLKEIVTLLSELCDQIDDLNENVSSLVKRDNEEF